MKQWIIWFIAILWAILIYRLTTTPQLVVTQDSVLQMIIMSGAHFIFFGIQAVLIYLALTNGVVFPIMVASGYGLAIELIQRGIAGRSADPVDWLLDTLGAIILVRGVQHWRKK